MKNSDKSVFSDENKRHELRKKLKLLKLNNMKLKKQLRLSMRVRLLNRSRLESQVNELNTILLKFNEKFGSNQQEPIISCNFNPKIMKYEDTERMFMDKENLNNSKQKLFPIPLKKKISEYKYYCDRCDFKCSRKAAFDIHMRRHTGEKPFSCDICEKQFVSKYELKLHVAKHSNSNIYHCDFCEYKTYRSDMLVNHMEKHSNVKTFNCDLCDFESNERLKLHTHKKYVHQRNINCIACDKIKKHILYENEPKVNDMKELTGILKETPHSCQKSHMCKYCGTFFKKQETLTKHIRTHTGERPYKCDRCDYAAAIKNTLIIHKRTHTGQKPYACDQCSFRCTTRSYLKIHLNQHKGIKPFACDLCDYRSVDSCKLIIHRKVRHNEDRPFSCEFCPFKAKLKSRLKLHVRIHGLRPFVCPHCAKSFTIRRALIEHEGIHNGNQPFKCELCKDEKKFTLKSTYITHKARHLSKYVCEKCSYKTNLQKDLLRHMNVHKNETYHPRRKFEKCLQCSFCKFKCAQGTTLYKHMKKNHLSKKSNSQLNTANESIEEFVSNANTITNATTSNITYPLVTTLHINNSISNIPPTQSVNVETNQELNPGLCIYNKDCSHRMSHEYSSFTYLKSEISIPSPVGDYNSINHMNQQITPMINMVQTITDTIHKCDQCEYSVADSQKLFIHRKTHHSKNNI